MGQRILVVNNSTGEENECWVVNVADVWDECRLRRVGESRSFRFIRQIRRYSARSIRLTEAHALEADNSPSRCDFYFELDPETLGAIPSLGTVYRQDHWERHDFPDVQPRPEMPSDTLGIASGALGKKPPSHYLRGSDLLKFRKIKGGTRICVNRWTAPGTAVCLVNTRVPPRLN